MIDPDSDDDDEQKALKARHGPRTRNEISLDDLPPIENLTITLSDETPIEPIGYIRHIIDGKLVIIEALLHSPPLNDDSVLFNSDRRSIGLIFETFGLVEKPYYSIRYHNAENLNQRHIELNQQVFYAPKETTYTKYVFVQELRALKGSDASWEDDNEPPKSAIDYSDDEQERTARAILKSKRTIDDGGDEPMMDSTNTDPTKYKSFHFSARCIRSLMTFSSVPPPYARTDRGRGRGRQRGFRRGAADSGRPPPSLPNWFQNTSSATSSFPSRPTFSQQQQPPPPSWRQSSHPTASTQFPFSSVPHSGNTNPRLQSTQQALQGNNSTHSVFPWM